ncbi:AraC family transcriptional regulator [Amycolatopsis orientalis]|uniref:AraC family transcriptional regulator n=2 Tax=Amycolatopsis orientalis TaxID=31958 RepID=A0A193BTI8_AMYOR|nr:AraC family transcriptional regulator [Amycolatopsis orientalis]
MLTRRRTWQGRAMLRPGMLIYAGEIASAHRHRHAAVQIVATRDVVELRDASGDRARGGSMVIPAGAEHEMVGGSAGLLVFVDPAGVTGHALTARVRRTGLPVDSAAAWAAAGLAPPDVELSSLEPAQWADRLLGEVGGDIPPRSVHPALRQAMALLPSMLDGEAGLARLSAAVGLSASRLGHLFGEELGLPFRAYVRWARLQRAIDHARAGGTLTSAAHAAGFADSAHLTRVSHEMFGLAPSHLVGTVRWCEPDREG